MSNIKDIIIDQFYDLINNSVINKIIKCNQIITISIKPRREKIPDDILVMLNSTYNKYQVYKNEKMINNEIKMKLKSNENKQNNIELKKLRVFELQTKNYFDVLTLDENDNELKDTDDLPNEFSFHIIDKFNKIKYISNDKTKMSLKQILKENECELKKMRVTKINVNKVSELKVKLKEHNILVGKIKELESYRKLGKDYINGKKIFENYKNQLPINEVKLLESLNSNNYLSMSEIVKGYIDLHQRFKDHLLEENMINLSRDLDKLINVIVNDNNLIKDMKGTQEESSDDSVDESDVDDDEEFED